MNFDSFTLVAMSCAITFVLGTMILLLWRRDRTATWLIWWGVGYLILSAAKIVLMFRSPSLSSWVLPLASAILLCGFSAVWQGARAFDQRKPLIWPFVAALAWPGLSAILAMSAGFEIRLMVMSALLASVLLLAAFDLWRGRAEKLSSRMPLVIILSALGLLFLARIPAAPFLPFPMGAQAENPLAVMLFNGPAFIAGIVAGVLAISMTLERAVLSQRTLAHRDPLTGLCNRRVLQDFFGDQLVLEGTSVVVFDLDEFKIVNDTHGHGVGDEFLRRFGDVCQKNIRKMDIAVRLGGEEFVVLMPETDVHMALVVAERVRRMFAKEVIATDQGSVHCTVSAGIEISTGEEGMVLEVLLARADAELYRAKNSGRNQVCLADHCKVA